MVVDSNSSRNAAIVREVELEVVEIEELVFVVAKFRSRIDSRGRKYKHTYNYALESIMDLKGLVLYDAKETSKL